ncbi:VWA domain-containing protein [Yoonia sediminilitoris]|uniref:Ca-activated chloride channel family protein n=1 Tax=Yoonia sediminilitoris TaxID=1286148 RepID=A0A2T6KHB5_9RHOB|nr:VWA domain-containing protein [Yoonia sediminilitoris]PUB14909.1 Ca-activated chloride channel family protein [Yoonia sediminilitoris]RCW95626.1 Ca-activated chloride channel family protein [Yoonia sediminilitoris]
MLLSFFTRLTAVTTLIAAFATPVLAQESRTTIVLDGSGSMWGQIDGEAKITIAQRALTGLIGELEGTTQLGLVAYGHRERGQCGDIETLVAPGPDNADAVLDALAGISPKGKTPLSDAVIFAAEGLRYTEDKATVILISDGIETCEADPCAVGQQLEQTGIDFTAHVIGFDVDDAAADQLACLADATGGQFIAAADAVGLADALEQVTVAAPPAPTTVTFLAETEGTGERIESGLVWTVRPVGGEDPLIENSNIAAPELELAAGRYEALVLSTGTEATTTADVVVVSGDAPFTVTLLLPAPAPIVALDVPATAVAGTTIDIGWTGPGKQGSYLGIHELDAPAGRYINYAYVDGGSPTSLLMPITPGTYEVRYLTESARQVLATQAIEITPVTATLDIPESAAVGATIPVAWTGPNFERDYITVAVVDAPGGQYENYTYTREGAPLDLVMPGVPGTYEIRYVASQDNTILAGQTITVTDQVASLDAPETADIGSTLSVNWTGPGYDGDFISVAREDQAPGAYENWADPEKGSPLDLVMPETPGFYELRYILGEDKRVLATRPITVLAVTATVTGPDTAMAGSLAEIGWAGPGYPDDYLTVAGPDAPPKSYEHWAELGDGPSALKMPDDPGTYELRYVLPEGDGNILAAQPITVLPAEATLTAPEEVVRGRQITVEWSGPNGPGDYLSLARPDAADTKYEDYIYTRAGQSVQLPAPQEPGRYELRYVMGGAKRVIARVSLEVTQPTARLAAPTTSNAGGVLQVAWQGPGGEDDTIAIIPRDGTAEEVLASGSVSVGNPVSLTLPADPGDFDLVYLSNDTILSRQEITLQ